METYTVQILNPKAVRLLQDLADLELITLQQEVVTTNVSDRLNAIDEETAKAREVVMRGAPTLNVDEMLEWLKESKRDRKLPFRDDE